MSNIRPKAICVCWRGDSILVALGHDAAKREIFYCPPGGGVEFGERAADAVRREIQEELGAHLQGIALLGVLENIFTHEGRPGHEIVFVFEAQFVDSHSYEAEQIVGLEGEERFVARWMPLRYFAAGGPPLYPDGLFELLTSRSRSGER